MLPHHNRWRFKCVNNAEKKKKNCLLIKKKKWLPVTECYKIWINTFSYQIITMASIELDIWRGEWGLASIDLECLKVLVSIFSITYIFVVGRHRGNSSTSNLFSIFPDLHEIYRGAGASSRVEQSVFHTKRDTACYERRAYSAYKF